MTLQERLRGYVEDARLDGDLRDYVNMMSQAADRIDELEKEPNLLNVAWLQGEFSELQAKVEVLLNEHAERGVRIEELEKCLAGWLSANCETGWIGELRAHAKASVSYMQERDTLKARIDELEKQVARLKTVPMKYRRMEFNAQLQKELEAKQARIDELMMEYCHEEMTPEQWKNYEDHQRPLTDDEK